MNFSKLSSFLILTRTKSYSLILLYLLIIGSTLMESLGIASFYPITEMIQDTNQLDYYRNKLVSWVPALEILDREQFIFFSLLTTAGLFVFKNVHTSLKDCKCVLGK